MYAAALQYAGTPYSWGGGSLSGPTTGIGQGSGTVGFDCSALALYAWGQAGAVLPRTTTLQAAVTTHLPVGAMLQAGDLLFFRIPGAAPGTVSHVGISDGAGGMIHAPTTGQVVSVVHGVMQNDCWGPAFAFATRP